MDNKEVYQEDELDLRDLFLILKKNWKVIIFTTLLVVVMSFIYIVFKNPIPLYSGNIMLEIGEVKSDNPNQTYFDKNQDLKTLIENQFDVQVTIPKRTETIITLTAKNTDKMKVEGSLKKVVDYVISRHQQKAKLYDQYIMTKQIGHIVIGDKPINMPKKKLILIISFITGLILSIFLVFFIEFIRGLKDEKGV